MKNSIFGGVAATVAAVASIGVFQMYTDLSILKEKVIINQEALNNRDAQTEQFQQFLYQMDKSLAIQAESVAGIKQAVTRLEQAVHTMNGKEGY